MAHNLNKYLRILFILLLLGLPIPASAEEVEEIETFDNGEQTTDIVVPPTDNSLVKIDNTWSGSYGMNGNHIELEYQKHGGTANNYEFTLPTEHDIYEVGFTIGAVNNQGTVEYTHNDETTQSNTIEAQSGLNSATMYEDIVYSVQETANKFIDSFIITINDWSLVDDISIKYDTTTTTTTTLNPLDVQRQANFASYGISETDDERGVREEEEAIIQEEIIQMEIQEAIEVENNMAETGYNETNEERAEREARTNVTIIVGDEEVTYTEKEQNDGTIERDQERAKNEELYGIALTDEQIERGDLELYDIEEEEIGEEFFEDSDIILIVADEDEYNELEFVELTEEEYEELEKQMEIDVMVLELEEELEIFEFDTKEEAEEFVETYLEIEEYIEELDEFATEVIIIEEDIDLIDIFIDNDLFPPKEEDVLKDLESVQDELIEKESISKEEIEIIEEIVEEEDEEVFEIFDIFTEQDNEEVLTEEMVEEEVAELEEVIEEIIVIDIPEVTEEELEEFTEEELVEYEEAKEEAIEEFVEELETEEVVEILEEINDVGVENLAEVSEEVIEVVAQVVEEVITIAQEEELTEEQIEVVAEVLGFEEEDDVKIIAELAKEDETVAQAVDEFVERAVENADKSSQPYTLADATTEIAFESFVASPISVIIDVDLGAIDLKNISDDMTQDQKDKAQEVIVPTILVRIVSFALRRFD